MAEAFFNENIILFLLNYPLIMQIYYLKADKFDIVIEIKFSLILF